MLIGIFDFKGRFVEIIAGLDFGVLGYVIVGTFLFACVHGGMEIGVASRSAMGTCSHFMRTNTRMKEVLATPTSTFTR